MQQTVLYGDFPKRLRCSGTLVLCIKGHASAGHMVVYIAMDQMVGNRQSPGAKILGSETVYLIRQPSLCSRRQVPCVVMPCGQCTRWLVLYFLTDSTLRRP